MKLVWVYRAPGGWSIRRQSDGAYLLRRDSRYGALTTELKSLPAAKLEAQRIADQEDPEDARKRRRARAWRPRKARP
jgi:hypothetical protein